MSRRITVMGATGKQGGKTIEALLNYKKNLINETIIIRGVTRDITSSSSKALEQKGVEMVQGSFDDMASLTKAFENTWGILLITTPYSKGQSVEKETQDGINCINAAIKSKVSYIVFNSVASADKNTQIPHFESKFQIEKYLISNSNEFQCGYCIIRPGFFMENFIDFFPPKNGIVSMPLNEHCKLQMISIEDIGKISAKALLNWKDFKNKQIDIATDNLNGYEIANILSQTSGQQIVYEESSWFVKKLIQLFSKDLLIMFKWFEDVGYNVDVQQVKKLLDNDIIDFKAFCFTHFNHADIGKQKMSNKKKLLIGTIVIGAIGIGSYYYYNKYYQSSASLSQNIHDIKQTGKEIKQDIINTTKSIQRKTENIINKKN